MDKRDLSGIFRERLKTLIQRSGVNQSGFAAAVGIDRSALSQLLSGASTRLPRAETLLNIASEHRVSLESVGGVDAAKRVRAGEPLDVVVLAREVIDDLIGAAFKINNPNAKSSCGCGTSFSL